MARNKTPSRSKKSAGHASPRARRPSLHRPAAPSTDDPTDRDGECKRALDLNRLTGNRDLAAGLYLVATPIGNLADITLRALETLSAADLIACEDTRRTRPLLTHYGISTKLVAYHDHNEVQAAQRLIAAMADGKSVALVSDAGMPLISDPGFTLLAQTRAAGLPVTSVPGPSAVLTALQLAGLPTDRFCFAGFAPPRSGARKKFLAEFATVTASLIFFESPRRLAQCLADMLEIFGPRQASVARELTKLHEDVQTGSLSDLAQLYETTDTPKGEVVVVVAPAAAGDSGDTESLDDLLIDAMASLTIREAVDRVATITGLPRRQVYDRALVLSGKKRAAQR